MIKLEVSDLLIDAKRWDMLLPPKSLDPLEDTSHTVGWVVNYHGKEYGDCVVITGDLTDIVLKESAYILGNQMNDTMLQVIYKETGFSWEQFAQAMMELKQDVIDSIKLLKE